MEQLDAPEVEQWVQREDARARAFAARHSERQGLLEEIRRIADVRRYGVPSKRGDRYYFLSFGSSGGPGSADTMLHVREGADGPTRTLIETSSLPDGTNLASAVPSPSGALVAYAVSATGSVWQQVRVMDVATGRTLPDRIEGLNSGASNLAWASDSGFYYERFDMPAGDERTTSLENERVMYHRVGTGQSGDEMIFRGSSVDASLTLGLSVDGRYLVVTSRKPAATGNQVFISDRSGASSGFRQVVASDDAAWLFMDGRGETLWFQTDDRAPNGRVVALELGRRAPEWREVVPEAREAINSWLGARMVGSAIVIGYLVDARTEFRIFDLNGRIRYTLELPTVGSVWSGFLPGAPDEGQTFYSLSGLVDPGTIYSLDLATGRSTLFERADLGYDPGSTVTEQVFYKAKDGTRVPMYVVRHRDARSGPAPTILYGYGFGSWSAAPWFQPHLAAWLQLGGAWALPNTRGGGEYGEKWHRAGSGRRKQVAIDDYIAAAEWLIQRRYTRPELLVANTSSAGGALVGAAIVQRPDLFGAAVLDYPVLDMLRYDRFTGARRWRSEYGTSDDPEDFRALLAYSPYHNITAGRCYPATLVAPGERDEITPPLHAYKFVAAMQHAQGCDNPIRLRVSWGAGHSSGATVDDAIETWADELAFLLRALETRGWRPGESSAAAGSE